MTNKVVARAIISDSEKIRVLLGKRLRNFAVGQWALFGGKQDPGETIQETVIREVREETGLEFIPGEFVTTTNRDFIPGEIWTVHYFRGKVTGKLKLKEDEHSEARWFSLSELEKIDIAFDHKERILEFFADAR